MSDVELFTASDGNFFTFCSRFLNGAIIDWSDANVRELCHKMAIHRMEPGADPRKLIKELWDWLGERTGRIHRRVRPARRPY